MKIFSFSSGAHDSSYAIYHDNKIISHDELERHTRIKECDGDILEFYSNNNPNTILGYYPHQTKHTNHYQFFDYSIL